MDNTKDRLGNNHEPFFHFVKKKKYYYDVDSIRTNPKQTKVVNGSVISATGVTGVKYKRQRWQQLKLKIPPLRGF